MKKYLYSFFFFGLIINTYSQTAFLNSGNVQLHDGAKIGFHTDVINNGLLDNYIGFAGFYADNETRIISGLNSITFFDVEVDALNNLELQTSLGVRNQLDFINGHIITPRNNTNIRLDFINYDFYAGENDDNHIDGYASIKGGEPQFTFPIGDGSLLRPMIIPNKNRFDLFKGAYFYEDPNTPSTFSTQFLTDQKQVMLENINSEEFWDLDGKNQTRITLTWDERSNIADIADNTSLLTVVGWSIAENEWVNLNVINVTGNLSNGQITSASFIPNDYEVITIGSIVNNEVAENNDNNIIISPNGDNLNEFLVFDEVNKYNNNLLTIYNRWGNIVFETKNYKNDWNGISNGRATINKKDELPNATYFFYLQLGDTPNKLSILKKGWVYIHR